MSRATGPLLDTGRGVNRGWWDGFPMSVNPSQYLVVMDDFARVLIDTTNQWTVIKDAGATVLIVDAANGKLRFTSTATTDNDGGSIQGREAFKLASGRTIWVEAKLQVSDATQMDVFVGLAVAFVTNPEAVMTGTDRIGFVIADGAADILVKTVKNSTETSTDSGSDVVAATDVVLGIRITGTTKVEFYVNGVLKATHTTNIVDDEELALVAYELSGDAVGTKTMDLDYILGVQSR